MKTPEELKALKDEVETLNKKSAELNEEEIAQVACGKCGPDGFVICWGDCHGAESDVSICRSKHARCEYGYL